MSRSADKLASEGYVDKAAFLKLADTDRVWNDVESVRQVPKNAALHHRLEGYLFPDTYEMEKGSKPEAIITRMLQELDRKLDTSLKAGKMRWLSGNWI